MNTIISWSLVVALVCVAFAVCIKAYNGLVRRKVIVQESYSGVSTYLQQRNELVSAVNDLLGASISHDHMLLASLRACLQLSRVAADMETQNMASRAMNIILAQLPALVHTDPALSKNNDLLQLKCRLDSLEQDINHSRKYYNGAVRDYNQQVQVFPANMVAKLFGFREEVFFLEDVLNNELQPAPVS